MRGEKGGANLIPCVGSGKNVKGGESMIRFHKHPMKWGLILALVPGFFFSSFIQGKGLAWEPKTGTKNY